MNQETPLPASKPNFLYSGFLDGHGSVDRIGLFIDDIEARVGEAESRMSTQDQTEFPQLISTLRQQIASVRRFLAPQRDALDRLYRQPGDVLRDVDILEQRDEADRMTRYLEDLDLAREQNSRMYVLSVVAAAGLPVFFRAKKWL